MIEEKTLGIIKLQTDSNTIKLKALQDICAKLDPTIEIIPFQKDNLSSPPRNLFGYVFPQGDWSRLITMLHKQHPVKNYFSPVVCIPHLTPSQRREAKCLEHFRIVTPAEWSPTAIAERLIGEFFSSLPPSRKETYFVGETPQIKEVYEDLKMLGPYGDPVLILGERGTGKELCARLVHDCSGRKGKLVPINCAALTPEMLESELFGHAKGAFTSAHTNREGLLAFAGAGTVFLDEIGELTLQSQAKLLRVLEENKVRPLGANQLVDLKARIVLATHRNLPEDCQRGRFRPDLYDRIKGDAVKIPSLRMRKPDIPLLVRHFIAQFYESSGRTVSLPGEGLDILFQYQWWGNVRELRGVIRNVAKFTNPSSGFLSPSIIERKVHQLMTAPPLQAVRDNTQSVEIDTEASWEVVQTKVWETYSKILLEKHGDVATAAKAAQVSKSTFYNKQKKTP